MKDFSSKLKPKEHQIWKEKVAKTNDDLETALTNAKKKPKPEKILKAQSCLNCSFAMSNYVVRLDSVLVMALALLHLVNADQIKAKKHPENDEVPVEETCGDEVVTIAQIHANGSDANFD